MCCFPSLSLLLYTVNLEGVWDGSLLLLRRYQDLGLKVNPPAVFLHICLLRREVLPSFETLLFVAVCEHGSGPIFFRAYCLSMGSHGSRWRIRGSSDHDPLVQIRAFCVGRLLDLYRLDDACCQLFPHHATGAIALLHLQRHCRRWSLRGLHCEG